MNMSLFSDNKNQVTCIYNGSNDIHKQTYAYINASRKKLLALDISKTNITGSQWAEIAQRLGKDIFELINFNSINESRDSISKEDGIKILCRNPEALLGTIILNNDIARQITNPSKVMEFISPDSAGIEKKRLSGM